MSGEDDEPPALEEAVDVEEDEVPDKREPILRKFPLSPREVLLSMAMLLPVPLYAASVAGSVAEAVLVAVGASIALALLLRRLPTPAPSIAALPVGVVWGCALLALPSGPWGLLAGVVAGILVLLFASLPDPTDVVVPLETVMMQVALPAGASVVSFAVAISLLGVSSPLIDVALLPVLGGVALVVYLFGREDVVPTTSGGPGHSAPPSS